MTTFKKAVIALALSTIIAAAGTICYGLYSNDLYPDPGSVGFYLKISPLIQFTPITSPKQWPVYHIDPEGESTARRSSVIYITMEKDEKIPILQIKTYLNQHGFSLSSDASEPGWDAESKKNVLYRATFKRSQEMVSVEGNLLPDKGEIEIKAIHGGASVRSEMADAAQEVFALRW